jgi:vacuolar protein sorting-associated protein 8
MGILCNFISQQITTKSLPDSTQYLDKIITFITSETDDPINSRQHIEKEQTFMNLMEANALNSKLTFEELLKISYRTKCYMVSKFILEKFKRFDKILECFVLSKNSFELFRYIMDYKSDDDRKIYQQVLNNFQAILEINSVEITNIIIEYYPICIQQFIKNISHIPKLHYEFLNEIIANGTIQLETENYNNFLVLQTEFHPEGVLEFLQNSNHTYDIQHAIKVIEKSNLSSAMIYLYEKNGEHRKAFTIAMDLLKESPESLAENYALKVGYLCMRASNVITTNEREAFWFELIDVIMSRNYLGSVVKQILHLASSFVDLNKLVQVIMKDSVNGNSKNFGDIKHILIGMLSNFEYESLLLRTSQNVLSRDLHKKLVKSKQNADVGIYCKIPKCVLCKKKLSDVIITEAGEDRSDQIIVFSKCGHSMHSSCIQKVEKTVENPTENDDENCDKINNMIRCKQCGVKIIENESIYLNKTVHKLFPEDIDVTIDLQLKAPTRVGLEYKK